MKVVVFDKTGTLTKGVFKVTAIRPESGRTEDELMELAAIAEANSNHPIAESIRAAWAKAFPRKVWKVMTKLPDMGLR